MPTYLKVFISRMPWSIALTDIVERRSFFLRLTGFTKGLQRGHKSRVAECMQKDKAIRWEFWWTYIDLDQDNILGIIRCRPKMVAHLNALSDLSEVAGISNIFLPVFRNVTVHYILVCKRCKPWRTQTLFMLDVKNIGAGNLPALCLEVSNLLVRIRFDMKPEISICSPLTENVHK